MSLCAFLDVDLLICKHQGPSCCTRKMEESYQFAVKRETLHNIHSYSYELEHLISGHSDAFQGKSQHKGAKLGLDGPEILGGYWWSGKRCWDSMVCLLVIWCLLYLPLHGNDTTGSWLDPAPCSLRTELIPCTSEAIKTKNKQKPSVYFLACKEYLFVQYFGQKAFSSLGSW